MNVIKTPIEGVLIIEPRIFRDARGYFFESFSQREFDEKVRPIHFCQDNESMSSYGVMRGLHFQRPPYTQSKLVRCVRGAVLDVAVDIRKGSPTYGQHVAVELTEDNHRQFFVPRGFAHGFSVLSDTAVFQYKCEVSPSSMTASISTGAFPLTVLSCRTKTPVTNCSRTSTAPLTSTSICIEETVHSPMVRG